MSRLIVLARRIALSLRQTRHRPVRLLLPVALIIILAASISPAIRRRLRSTTTTISSSSPTSNSPVVVGGGGGGGGGGGEGGGDDDDFGCEISLGRYEGRVYDHRDVVRPVSSMSSSNDIPRFETIDNECLVESPWMRVARHTVRLSRPHTRRGGGGGRNDDDDGGGGNGDASDEEVVLDDWLWIDYHDRINVLVEAPSVYSPPVPDIDNRTDGTLTTMTTSGGVEYLIFEQSKYALDVPSMAIVGGVVGNDESPIDAARREVREELSVTCREWIDLGGGDGGGGYRTDVNRGMGWVHPFLARDCIYVRSGNDDGDDEDDIAVVGGLDVEERAVRRMTISEVREAVVNGKFVEVQWSNTVALAMLRLLPVLPSPPPSPADDSRGREDA
ncbi:hypothetical protein ACHAXA_006784 [Cyclostephanos tholiformis]|uniref:Nudix hydrolase domain-containing protein n=1 Tax=Cyclostephanos tholiformis TaxID=382380 RepID=A0ABD3RFP2_9STRA